MSAAPKTETEIHDALERAASGDPFPGPYNSDYGTIYDARGVIIGQVSFRKMGDSSSVNATGRLFAASYAIVATCRPLLDAIDARDSALIIQRAEPLRAALLLAPYCRPMELPVSDLDDLLDEVDEPAPADEPTEPAPATDPEERPFDEEDIPF